MSSNSTSAQRQPATSIILPYSPTSTILLYTTHEGNEIDDAILDRCAKLFSDNYGIWGQSPDSTKGPKLGTRVKMSGRKLRQECVAVPGNTVLVMCYQRKLGHHDSNELELVGHAFATVWDYNGGRVGWVTQLVVSVPARKRYIATSLLQMLKTRPIFAGITTIGLASSHPSACHALSKYTDFSIHSVDMKFCKENAKAILQASPVDYVKNMELRGSLFEEQCTTGAISCVFTNFHVDHKEPLDVLALYKTRGPWPLAAVHEL